MEHSDGTFTGAGDLPLYYQRWFPDRAPRAVVAIVHGVLEHSDRYPALVEHLVPQGFALYAFDLRGHGRSAGVRVHVDSWSDYQGDLHSFLALIRQEQGDLPPFLYAHSLGAIIALDYLLDHPQAVRGAIISGAALEPGEVASPLVVALARLLARIAPRTHLPMAIKPTALSRDPQVVQQRIEDPLMQESATARWGMETLAAVERVNASLGKLRTPLLILHGEADPANLPVGSRRLFQALPIEDKALHLYPGGLHEPHNDIQREQVMADVAAWIEAHL